MFSGVSWTEPKRRVYKREGCITTCWTPLMWYNNLKHASYYCLGYTALIHFLGLCYAASVIAGDRSAEFYSPFFEFDGQDMLIATSLTIVYVLFFMIFCIILGLGLRTDNRFFFWPWMLGMALEIVIMVAVGIWYVTGYWFYLYSVYAAIFIWILSAFHLYMLLCVTSYFKVLGDDFKVEVLYPDEPQYHHFRESSFY